MPTDSSSPSQPPTPSISTTSTPPRNRAAEYEKFKNFAAYTFLIASPVCIALPPRKLDFYTFSLGAAFVVSANHISSVRTGRGILGHIQSRIVDHGRPSVLRELPTPQAEAVQAQLRAARGGTAGDANGKRKFGGAGEKEGVGRNGGFKEEASAVGMRGRGDWGFEPKEHIWEGVEIGGRKTTSERMGEEQGEGGTKRKGNERKIRLSSRWLDGIVCLHEAVCSVGLPDIEYQHPYRDTDGAPNLRFITNTFRYCHLMMNSTMDAYMDLIELWSSRDEGTSTVQATQHQLMGGRMII
ncbi:hypothetical protein PAAG_06604 [Paracoccidioides lutzii Pb01]|uniref:Uncharacterized protein n=1 Tax=Paracoccidioides lutzii (strain ATCC MYA-826 / Pb01) TaxID=502779 RepID=C1H763_PARBA|nr:hypothetical protein PAAG_06604 [Paracoccidioides lutzii Pb01]EEH35557.2 hypothetical protein PAAG_06604 [Paracoccidioides lutzii Pb01]